MSIKPYALSRDEGRIYEVYGLPFNIKAGSYETHDGLTFIEFVTRKGEEPGRHTHDGEDEIFYVLEGEVEFWCGGETFRVSEGGFVFLPRNIEHGYTILSDGDVRFLIVCTPPRWAESLEVDGEPVSELAMAERARRNQTG